MRVEESAVNLVGCWWRISAGWGGVGCRQRERGLGLVDIASVVLFRCLVSLLFFSCCPLS